MISVLILSKADKNILKRMTQYAVLSAIEAGIKDVVVLEQVPGVEYEGARTFFNEGEFNYNRSMNRGVKYCRGDYIAMCNNDMYFYPNFAYIERIMRMNGIMSASPYCLNNKYMPIPSGDAIAEGYEVGKTLLGYCIVVNRKIFNVIGDIDEAVSFWWSETLYANQLKAHNITHHLICNVFIDHFESITLKNSDKKLIQKYTKRSLNAAIIENTTENI